MMFSQAKTHVRSFLATGRHWVYSTSPASVQPQPELHLNGLLRGSRILQVNIPNPMEIPGLNTSSMASL